jgi:hypothetical protein
MIFSVVHDYVNKTLVSRGIFLQCNISLINSIMLSGAMPVCSILVSGYLSPDWNKICRLTFTSALQILATLYIDSLCYLLFSLYFLFIKCLIFSGVLCYSIMIFCVVFCWQLFDFLSLFFLSLHCRVLQSSTFG